MAMLTSSHRKFDCRNHEIVDPYGMTDILHFSWSESSNFHIH